jgi:hypothetical protein
MEDDKTIWKGELADFWFDEQGILHGVTKSCPHSVEMVKQNVKLVNEIVCSNKVCGIIYLTQPYPYDIRSFKYIHKKICNSFTALAYVAAHHTGIVIAALSDCLNTNVRFFDSPRKAKRWIKKFLPPPPSRQNPADS